LSILTNDCIAKGKDYNAGGARYNTSYLQGVGIGTVTDSLCAIKYHVYEHGNFSMAELLAALKDDFAGEDDILSAVRNDSPRYGNDDDSADDLMQDIFECYRRTVTGRPNVRGGMYRVNMLPTTCHVYFGEVTGALPSGRKAGIPVSEGISPVGGADIYGPTAVIRSCAKMDHLQTGGTLLNQKFTPSAISGEKGLDAMAALIRSYFNMDGHHIQFNVVDKETLLEAQRFPEEHRDLIVRVAGYSDYFRNLSRALQDEIICRTEQSV
jgi:formate C-acetyltransferase